MKYRVAGKLILKKDKKFTRQIEASSENMARHKIYSFFGNVYRIPRRKIIIESVEEI
ncbi:MAG: 50S ribosomal protein L18Ae [Candidatus Micrarchaeia archaeon]